VFEIWIETDSIFDIMMDIKKYDMKEMKLKFFFPKLWSKLIYWYDFGDDWKFDVSFENEIIVEEKLPIVLGGKWLLLEDFGWPI